MILEIAVFFAGNLRGEVPILKVGRKRLDKGPSPCHAGIKNGKTRYTRDYVLIGMVKEFKEELLEWLVNKESE